MRGMPHGERGSEATRAGISTMAPGPTRGSRCGARVETSRYPDRLGRGLSLADAPGEPRARPGGREERPAASDALRDAERVPEVPRRQPRHEVLLRGSRRHADL